MWVRGGRGWKDLCSAVRVGVMKNECVRGQNREREYYPLNNSLEQVDKDAHQSCLWKEGSVQQN